MPKIDLDQRLQEDCYLLGEIHDTSLLLSRNAHFPWFILVPETDEIEFYRLEAAHQQVLLDLINKLSAFVGKHFSIDKLNIATIGNIVSQMHIHIVGRYQTDVCWPGVVWGCDQFKEYPDGDVEGIRDQLELDFPGLFTAAR